MDDTQADVEGLELCATIAERDNAELAVSMMYRAVTGKEPEWSSEFRLSHAVVEVEAALTTLQTGREQALEEAAKPTAWITNWRKPPPDILEWDHYVSHSEREVKELLANLKRQGVKQFHTWPLGTIIDEWSDTALKKDQTS